MGTVYFTDVCNDGADAGKIGSDANPPVSQGVGVVDWPIGDFFWVGFIATYYGAAACNKAPSSSNIIILVRKDGGSWLSLADSDLAAPGTGNMVFTDLTPANANWFTGDTSLCCATDAVDGTAEDNDDTLVTGAEAKGVRKEFWFAIDPSGGANGSLYEFAIYDSQSQIGTVGSPFVLACSVTVISGVPDRNINIDDEEPTIIVTDVVVDILVYQETLEISIEEPLITVTDVPTDLALELVPNVFEPAIVVTDVPTVDVTGPTLEINIAETLITVTDVLDDMLVYQETLEVSIAEPVITVTDVVTDMAQELVPSVFDEVTVTDIVDDLAFELVPSVFDGVTVDEDITVTLPDALEIDVFETAITVTDEETVEVQDAESEYCDQDTGIEIADKGDVNSSASTARGYRAVYHLSDITLPGCTPVQVRVEFFGHVSGCIISGASIGVRSGSTEDMVSAPVRLTFDGEDTGYVPSEGSIFSDWIEYPYDLYAEQLIHFCYVGATKYHMLATTGRGTVYWKNTTSDDTLLQVLSGEGYSVTSSWWFGIGRVEVRGPVLQIRANDAITVTDIVDDVVILDDDFYEISEFDTTTVTEDITVVLPDPLLISVFDTTTVTESVDLAQELVISVYEDITVTDEETVSILESGVLEVSVFDITGVTEYVELVQELVISVFDTTTVTDVETVNLFQENLEISIFSATTVTEYVDLAKELTLSVFDGTAVTDVETVEVGAGPTLEIDVYETVTVEDVIDSDVVVWIATQEGIQGVTGEFASPLATGTQKIAHGLGAIPTAIILFTSMVQHGSVQQNHSRLSKGFMDSSGNEFLSGYMCENAADPMNTRCWSYDNKIIFMEDMAEGVLLDAECGATAWTDSHFYIDWNTVDSNQYRIAFVAITGITAKVGSFAQRSGTGTQDVTVGWQPDAIIAIGGASIINTPQAHARFFHGCANKNDEETFACIQSEDNQTAPDATYWAGPTGRFIVRIDEVSFSSTPADSASIQSIGAWPSDGFQIDWTVDGGLAIPVGYLAIQGVESYTYYDTEPTGIAPQDVAVTGVGFEPQFLMIVTPGYPWGGVASNAVLSVGFARTPQYEVATAVCDDDTKEEGYSTGRMASNRVFDRISCWNKGLRSSAELKGFDADGFTLTYQTTTDISAQPFTFMVLRQSELAISVFDTITVTDIETVILPDDLEVSEFESVGVTDVRFITLVSLIDVYEDVTVQEDVSVLLSSNLLVFDGVTVTEEVTVSLPDALLVDVFDGVTTVDEPTVEVGIIGVYHVSVYDEITVTDVPVTVLPDALIVSVYDTTIIADVVNAFILDYFISVSDTVTVLESVTVVPHLKINIFDTITVTESTPVALDDIEVSVFDATSVTDVVTFFIPNFGIDVFETVTVSEGITALLPDPLEAVVFDTVTVTDTIEIYWVVSAGLTFMEMVERAPDIEFLARIPEIDYDERRPRIDFEVRS